MNCRQTEVNLSGYIDRELTQQEAQKVELHLATCNECREVLEELQLAKQAAEDLDIQQPSREEWKEMEHHILERATRGVGWIILIVWSIATSAYGALHYALSPTEPLFQKILIFGLFLGFALIFFSVLMERVRESRTDRYRGVQK
jgi:predicted anti-sigma-YlaC factor YlaD